MIRIALIVAIFTCHLSRAQTYNTAKSLNEIQSDSSFLSVYLVATKEMVQSEDQVMEKLLDRKQVANEDIEKLLRKASKKSSYQDESALLTHYNIIIDLYSNGAIYGTLTLSSITGNITINDVTSERLHFGNVSKKFGGYVIHFLDDYDVLKLISPMDLQGLNKDFD